MIANPLARARRLGTTLERLRTTAKTTRTTLAQRSGVSTSAIARIEAPLGEVHRSPSLANVRALADALGVARKRKVFAQLDQLTEDAGRRHRWWSAHPNMGEGQKLYALAETGASAIDEYGGLLIPGLLQTEAYAAHRSRNAGDPAAVVTGRLHRQQILDTGVTYRVVLQEQAIRRRTDPAVMAEQLRHLLDLSQRGNVSIQVLPVDADLGDGPEPCAPFAHVGYPEPDDPTIVVVDDVTRTYYVVDHEDVGTYARLHQRLRDAALSATDSAVVIEEAANRLAA